MSDSSTTEGNVSAESVSTPPPAATPPVSHDSKPQWAADLESHLTALPETLARSIKEAVGTPKAPEKTPEKPSEKDETKAATETKTHAEPGTNKTGSSSMSDRFNHWWFG